MHSIQEIESLTALQHVEGYVWCDHHCSVHEDTPDVYDETGYRQDGTPTECDQKNWRPLFMEPDEVVVERGTPFVCYCRCHDPSGFKLMPGQQSPPGMRPCNKCKGFHP